jgi:hypothetical protein
MMQARQGFAKYTTNPNNSSSSEHCSDVSRQDSSEVGTLQISGAERVEGGEGGGLG